MALEKWKAEISEAVASMTDEELAKFFPPCPTIEERIAELGRLSGHKYLSPDNMVARENLIQDLLDEEVLTPAFENPFPGRVATLFDFVGPNKEVNERIYSEAFGKQLLGHHRNED